MLSRNRLIRRLLAARSQRRLFTGDRGAIAASLIEIGVAMLAVGILAAGSVTTFSGFIDSASDTTARARLTDAASTADQVYNWLRPAGARCYAGTDCTTITDAAAVTALQEAAGGQLEFAEWDPDVPTANTIYVQVDASSYAQENNILPSLTTGDHNGISGDPDDGRWVRMAIRSDSGATFCVIKVAQTDNPVYEGVGYKSVNSASSAESSTSAHCGGHEGSVTGTNHNVITVMSCVFGFAGASTAQSGVDSTVDIAIGSATCDNARSLERPGAHSLDIAD